MEKNKVLTVKLDPRGNGGWYTVYSAQFPGCISQGKTVSSALRNFAEAYSLWSDVKNERNETVKRVGKHVQSR